MALPVYAASSQSIHAEAAAWAMRASMAGGAVSSTTLRVVSRFCRAIDSNGLRGSFYRLNLLCGDFSSALTPLYVSSSPGSRLGGDYDTASGFVSADYAETGATGGITRALGTPSSSKSYVMGLTANQMPQLNTVHFGIGISTRFAEPSGESLIACYPYPAVSPYYCSWYAGGSAGLTYPMIANSNDNGQSAAIPDNGRLMAVRSSTTDARTYRNGAQTAVFSSAVATRSGHNTPWTMFGPATTAVGVLYYTIGNALTAQQVTALDAILSNYASEMGRA